jgi:prefoldin subunit 5
LSQDCKEQENKLQSQIEHLSNEISNIQAKQGLANNTKEIISQFKNITELDRYTVQTLIDYIEVGGNKTNRIINIHWNF